MVVEEVTRIEVKVQRDSEMGIRIAHKAHLKRAKVKEVTNLDP